jgi:hypothetical protein
MKRKNQNADKSSAFFIFMGKAPCAIQLLLMEFSGVSRNFTRKIFLFLFFLLVILHPSSAQKQLILLKHGNVIARFAEESYFRCVLKNGRHIEATISELSEFYMILSSRDTIAFQSIKKIDFGTQRRKGFLRGDIGGLLFAAGLVYLGVDQLNKAFGYSSGGWDQSDTNALIVAGVGAALLFIKPRYGPVKPGVVMRTIDVTSPFYIYLN